LGEGLYFVGLPSHTLEEADVASLVCTLEELGSIVCSRFVTISDKKHIGEIHAILDAWLPFGGIRDTNVANINTARKIGFQQQSASMDLKRPSWKPYLYRGKGKVEIVLQEEISAAQYDKDALPDSWKVHGTINIKADLEGLPEVTLGLTWPPKPNQIQSFLLDSRAQGADVTRTKKICFSPPLGQFLLATYSLDALHKLPLRGFYQMKSGEAGQIKILVQLKLDEAVHNEFEYCEVHIPLPNRGRIASVQASPTLGSVRIEDNRAGLVWDIGQRISTRNLEVALPATIFFDKVAAPHPKTDPFCTGSNAFIKLHFKVVDYLLSGLNIDTRNTAVYPNTKLQMQVNRQLCSGQYLVWNSWGGVRHAEGL